MKCKQPYQQYVSIGGYNAIDKIRALCKEHGASVRSDVNAEDYEFTTRDTLIITHPEYKIYLPRFEHWATREVCLCGCDTCIDGWDKMKEEIEKEIKEHSTALADLTRAKFIWRTKMGGS